MRDDDFEAPFVVTAAERERGENVAARAPRGLLSFTSKLGHIVRRRAASAAAAIELI